MRLLAQFVGVLLLVGFVGAYFWWIVAALAAVALVYFARRWWLAHRRRVAEREAEHAAIAARADQQHAWVLAGDDRGVCGAYPPAVTGFRRWHRFGGGSARDIFAEFGLAEREFFSSNTRVASDRALRGCQ